MAEFKIDERAAQAIVAANSPEEIRRILHEQAILQGIAREIQVSGASTQVPDGSIVLAPLPVRPKTQVNSGNFESGTDAMIARRMREVTGHSY